MTKNMELKILRQEKIAMAIKKKVLHQTNVTAMRTITTSLEIANFAYAISLVVIVKGMHL